MEQEVILTIRTEVDAELSKKQIKKSFDELLLKNNIYADVIAIREEAEIYNAAQQCSVELNCKFFIQDANGNLLEDLEKAIKGKNGEGFTKDNSSPSQALAFDFDYQAKEIIDKNGWLLCEVVQLPYIVINKDNIKIAALTEYYHASCLLNASSDAKGIYLGWCSEFKD
jgi:hypothetical protein